MMTRRLSLIFAVALGLTAPLPLPAAADSDGAERKTVSGPGGRSGTVTRYAERSDGRVHNSVTMGANDPDGRGGRCTETWIDYRTRPHQHLNPALFVNCSGRTRRAARVADTSYEGVVGVGVVVCEVPDTSGPITRNERNCRGRVKEMHLHSGQRYDRFRVDAPQYPSGVRIWRG